MSVLELGARLATPGEFTRQAFINGRIDLTRAESVIDMIHAQTPMGHAVALGHLQGGLFKQVSRIRSRLMTLFEQIEGSINFPDEVDGLDRGEFAGEIRSIVRELEMMIQLQDYGQLIHSGVHCVIVGRPNAGKSSLLNQLAGQQRAIVTSIPGTTRDFLEVDVELGGLMFRFIDTAGIRTSTDYIESLGMRKIKTLIHSAQVVLWVVDSSKAPTDEDEMIYKKIKSKKNIYVIHNKIDRSRKFKKSFGDYPEILLSAKTGEGIDRLKASLHRDFSEKYANVNLDLVCNVRQLQCLKEANTNLSQLLNGIENRMEDDVLSIDLKSAIVKLGEVTGEEITEEVLDGIFSRFCVGK